MKFQNLMIAIVATVISSQASAATYDWLGPVTSGGVANWTNSAADINWQDESKPGVRVGFPANGNATAVFDSAIFTPDPSSINTVYLPGTVMSGPLSLNVTSGAMKFTGPGGIADNGSAPASLTILKGGLSLDNGANTYTGATSVTAGCSLYISAGTSLGNTAMSVTGTTSSGSNITAEPSSNNTGVVVGTTGPGTAGASIAVTHAYLAIASDLTINENSSYIGPALTMGTGGELLYETTDTGLPRLIINGPGSVAGSGSILVVPISEPKLGTYVLIDDPNGGLPSSFALTTNRIHYNNKNVGPEDFGLSLQSSGTQLLLTIGPAVPEPASTAMISVGALLLLRRRR